MISEYKSIVLAKLGHGRVSSVMIDCGSMVFFIAYSTYTRSVNTDMFH